MYLAYVIFVCIEDFVRAIGAESRHSPPPVVKSLATYESAPIIQSPLYVCVFVCMYIQGVTGGTDQTSGGCSLC